MKQIQFHATGEPHRVVQCAEVAEAGPLAADQVLVQVAAFPINQADLLTLRGNYASPAQGPATLGQEAVGRVMAVGAEVERLRVDDMVILLGQQCWSEYRQVHWSQALAVPATIELLQLAMLKINPATAMLLMDRFVALGAGDWIVCNAANSAVGRSLIQLARRRGLRTVAVARREEVLDDLRGHGADLAVLDGPDLAQRVHAGAAGVHIRLGADAVGGAATAHLLACLGDGATLVAYGGLRGEPCQVGIRDLVFRDLRVRGFWLTRELAETAYERLVDLYAGLARQMASGDLRLPVEAIYPMRAIADAVAHAGRSGHGKIIVTTPAYAAMALEMPVPAARTASGDAPGSAVRARPLA